MADVFTVLAQDHGEVKDMLAELEQSPAGNTLADEATGQEQEAEQILAELNTFKAAGPVEVAADEARGAVTGRGAG